MPTTTALMEFCFSFLFCFIFIYIEADGSSSFEIIVFLYVAGWLYLHGSKSDNFIAHKKTGNNVIEWVENYFIKNLSEL